MANWPLGQAWPFLNLIYSSFAQSYSLVVLHVVYCHKETILDGLLLRNPAILLKAQFVVLLIGSLPREAQYFTD